MSYEGWENYETWCVNLWLSNDEGLYREVRDMALNYQPSEDEDEDYDQDEAVNNLADEIQLFVESFQPEINGLFGDLLNRSLRAVDWREIAFAWIEEEG